jgi:hypothetical protein
VATRFPIICFSQTFRKFHFDTILIDDHNNLKLLRRHIQLKTLGFYKI